MTQVSFECSYNFNVLKFFEGLYSSPACVHIWIWVGFPSSYISGFKVMSANYLGPFSKLSLQMSHPFLLSPHQSLCFCRQHSALFLLSNSHFLPVFHTCSTATCFLFPTVDNMVSQYLILQFNIMSLKPQIRWHSLPSTRSCGQFSSVGFGESYTSNQELGPSSMWLHIKWTLTRVDLEGKHFLRICTKYCLVSKQLKIPSTHIKAYINIPTWFLQN